MWYIKWGQSIRACDPDIIEESNLPRIPYASVNDVGKPKAKISMEHAERKNPDIDIFCYENEIECEEALNDLKEANMIFGAVDNDAARRVLNEYAARYSIPLIDLGTEIIPDTETYEAIGQAQIFIPGQTGCLTCSGSIDPCQIAFDSMSEDEIAAHESAGYIRGTDQTPTPSVLHLNGVVSHLAISQFLKLIFNDEFSGKDFLTYNRNKSSLLAASTLRDDECPVCGINGYMANGDEDEDFEELEELKSSSDFEQIESLE